MTYAVAAITAPPSAAAPADLRAGRPNSSSKNAPHQTEAPQELNPRVPRAGVVTRHLATLAKHCPQNLGHKVLYRKKPEPS
ncbi:MAG TPA: hypothetical protein VEB41_10550 [Burkholderiales bacterium]|nr:hypothetical protein [Burkholderiales bacterium]